MEAARNAVTSFLGGSGKHETEVDETVNPAVTSETVKPHVHEETTQAVDKEVHQDHYHTTVQPIAHRETLPEQHTHQLAPQVEKVVQHGNLEQDQARNAQELGQFRDSSVVEPTTQSAAAAGAVTGEHTHHHVHETVQPIIHKEVIQPEVVHTTIPIHEKHIAPSEHHGISELPMKSMSEFKEIGADLTTKHHSTHEYTGHPKPYNADLQLERKPVDVHPEQHDGTHDPEKTGHFSGSSTSGTGIGSTRDSGISSGHGNSAAMGSGVAGVAAGSVAQDLGRDHARAGQNTDLSSRDTTGPVGDSGIDTSGTSLGGRTGGNTVAHESTTTSRATDSNEPTNLTGGSAEPKSEISRDDNVQHASQIGEDPSLVQSGEAKSGKLTGTGTDGSHSAVFGLTPDGHTFKDTKSAAENLTPASNDESSKTEEETSTGSRGVGTGKVAEQMNDPRVAEKEHEGAASYGDDGTKPGAGMSTSHIV